jgi:hypothetical protein
MTTIGASTTGEPRNLRRPPPLGMPSTPLWPRKSRTRVAVAGGVSFRFFQNATPEAVKARGAFVLTTQHSTKPPARD